MASYSKIKLSTITDPPTPVFTEYDGFPTSPIIGQEFYRDNGDLLIWDGVNWVRLSSNLLDLTMTAPVVQEALNTGPTTAILIVEHLFNSGGYPIDSYLISGPDVLISNIGSINFGESVDIINLIGLSASTTYDIIVSAINTNGDISPDSEIVTLTTSASDTYPITNTISLPEPSISEIDTYGSYMIVGYSLAFSRSGLVEIYNTSTGELIASITNPNVNLNDTDDLFGCAVAIWGNYAVVGARDEDVGLFQGQGKAYIFKTTTGDWSDVVLHRSLTYTNPIGQNYAAGDSFGQTVAIYGDYALISAPNEYNATGTITRVGVVSVYNVVTGAFVRNLFPTPTPNYNQALFGWEVQLYEDLAFIHMFTSSSSTDIIKIVNITTGNVVSSILNPYQNTNAEYFGWNMEVSSDGLYLLVGARATNSAQGRAYLYSSLDGSWTSPTLEHTFLPSEISVQFGGSVAFGADKIYISDLIPAGTDDRSGAVYVYDLATRELIETILNPNLDGLGKYIDNYGEIIATSDNELIVWGRGEEIIYIHQAVVDEPLLLGDQIAYTTPGTYSWTAPEGVTSVSVVAVGAGGYNAGEENGAVGGGGGGALAYKNNISVTPGQSYSVIVGRPPNGGPGGPSSFTAGFGTMLAGGGGGNATFRNPASIGGVGGVPSGTYDAGFAGGAGGNYTAETLGYGGGGGAGGYSGVGGAGGSNNSIGSNGSGGGGGGGGSAASQSGTLGGGVGLQGEGASGIGGAAVLYGNGNAGSGGTGKQYGGGGTAWNGGFSALGGTGAVRIIWPGDQRQFPSTRTDDE
jgi:hypothetical protein